MKISFKNEGEVKIHSEKQNIANTLPPAPQKNGKQVLYGEETQISRKKMNEYRSW